MPQVVVSIEVETQERIEYSVPLNVPSQGLAAAIMRDLGRLVRTGESFALVARTARGEKRIPSSMTLGEFGILEGQQLRVLRESGGLRPDPSPPHAYLHTHTGVLLALDSDYVMIGRKNPGVQSEVNLDLSRYDPGCLVSRLHAAILRHGRKYSLIDLNSMNGTRLNGERLQPGRKKTINSGDIIEFGQGPHLTFLTAEARAKLRGKAQTGALPIRRGPGKRS